MRVLQWIISRADNEIGAAETALGYEPNTHDIDMEGLEMSMYDMRRLLSVDRELWLQECEDAREYYEKIGKVPPELYEELDALEMRLNRGYKVKHEKNEATQKRNRSKSGSFFNVSSLVKFAPRMAQRDFLKKVALPLF